MRKLCLLSLLLMTVSCNQSVQMTEDAAIAKLQEFFEFLDIEQYNKNVLAEVVTDDFHIFEMGQDFTLDAFDAFIQEAAKTTVSTSWTLSDFVVSIDGHSAHLAYLNEGLFETTEQTLIHSRWMESAYMVVQDDVIKLKFLQSDLVNREVETRVGW
tara:strand:+ start:1555 stop:2022 length:468 start_codon:yes stop_codon:yes gene_type:complete